MLLRTIRHIVVMGAAFGLAGGARESCSLAFPEIGSAPTLPETATPEQGRAECPQALLSLVGFRVRCVVRHRYTSRIAAYASGCEPALAAFDGHPAEDSLREVDAYVADDKARQRGIADSARGAAPNHAARGRRTQAARAQASAERIARAQASADASAAERIASEQISRDRVAAERIARQQEEASERTVERIVREQTEINRRVSARIAREQAARDRLEIERIKRRQAAADRRAVEAILQSQAANNRFVAKPNIEDRNPVARQTSQRVRALHLDRIERALRKTASILDRAHLPR